MEVWINELWLLGTAIIFTVVGMGFSRHNAMDLTEAVIDSLIEQGYMKVKGEGENMEILTWQEWCNDQDSGKTS
jgi:hypothetical protein